MTELQTKIRTVAVDPGLIVYSLFVVGFTIIGLCLPNIFMVVVGSLGTGFILCLYYVLYILYTDKDLNG